MNIERFKLVANVNGSKVYDIESVQCFLHNGDTMKEYTAETYNTVLNQIKQSIVGVQKHRITDDFFDILIESDYYL